MSDVVIVAIISLIGTLSGSLFGVLASNKLTNYRIQRLEEEVRKYNNVKERVFELEKKEAVHCEEIKVANHRIEDLEHIEKAGE